MTHPLPAWLRTLVLACTGVLLCVPVQGGDAVEDVLLKQYPGASWERKLVRLDEVQREKASLLAGSEVAGGLTAFYEVRTGERLLARAFLDVHVVRTLPETLLISVDPAGHVEHVAVLAFREPRQYQPAAGWYAQFAGRKLDETLELAAGIDGVTGATLTARATTRAVRRALALNEVLGPCTVE